MNWAETMFIIEEISRQLGQIKEDLNKIKQKLEISEDENNTTQ